MEEYFFIIVSKVFLHKIFAFSKYLVFLLFLIFLFNFHSYANIGKHFLFVVIIFIFNIFFMTQNVNDNDSELDDQAKTFFFVFF